MTIYLYVKAHRKTGLKYLGKTTRDPHRYKGSGVYWKSHIKAHGYDVDTQILRECQTVQELKEWGLYYSNLWNVVESAEWANLKPEEGNGFSSEQSKKLWEDPEYQQKQSDISKKRWEDPEFQKKISSQANKPEYQQQQRKRTQKRWEDPEQHQTMSVRMKQRWEDPEYQRHRSEITSGKNNPRYDHTQYHFVHKEGIERHCTRHELLREFNLSSGKLCLLIRGDRKTHQGWSIMPI